MRIGLVAAMPEECAPLLKRAGGYAPQKTGQYPSFRFRVGRGEVFLVRSGMGPERSAAATGALIQAFRPEMVISFGLGGGVLPGPKVGDLVLAERLLWLREGLFTEQRGLSVETAHTMRAALAAILPDTDGRLHLGSFITSARIENKRLLAERLPPGIDCPLLEMETCAVARVVAEAGLPFLAIRAVSDDAGEELDFDLEEFCDAELNVRVSRVLLTLARKPWILPQLLRLARHSRLAGERLADGVMALLETLDKGMTA